ncbi:MFS general substrate transporter [Zopfia rhizophila CBS 207.26]|uniref:MFS general substrate transporter n=1 Tax=Zopfia rhizophila CBS 207.26 TaxID=1314779 RepID=A0A6A6DQ67_9PEZI|nr:MFS general substrate transporter [Zopfia rhizophila CBS 207.26]
MILLPMFSKYVVEEESPPLPATETVKKEKNEEAHEPHSISPASVSRLNDVRPETPRDLETLSAVESGPPPYSVFTKRKKHFIVFLAAWGALITLSREFNVSSTLMNLTLTSYMVFQGLAPIVFGDLANTALVHPSMPSSSGSSATIALGNGVVADVATSSERGAWMGYATSGPMVAPAVTPAIGGLLAEFLGWRSMFWFLVIMVAIYLIPFFIAFPETTRGIVGNRSVPPQGWNTSLLNYLEMCKARQLDNNLTRATSREEHRAAQVELVKKRKFRFPNPLGALRIIVQKDTRLLSFYNSLVYAAFYDVIALAPYLFEQIYGFSDLEIGLSFIPFPFRSSTLGSVAVPFIIIGSSALLCYGWSMEVETSLAAPLVMHSLMGLFLTALFNCVSVMLIDYYPLSPSTATVANNLVRCLVGAVVFATSPILWVLLKWGPGWREDRRVRMEAKNEREG